MKSLRKPDFNFSRVPQNKWPIGAASKKQFDLHLSKDFLVSHYQEENGIIRLSINRTQRIGDQWKDGITWDELQAIKNAVGYSGKDAVEVYPAEPDVVNVANIRHLWVMPQKIAFTWRAK